MMIVDDYRADAAEKSRQSSKVNTPAPKRSSSRKLKTHLPMIREKNNSISRRHDSFSSIESASVYHQKAIVICPPKRRSACLDLAKVVAEPQAPKRRDLFPVLNNNANVTATSSSALSVFPGTTEVVKARRKLSIGIKNR